MESNANQQSFRDALLTARANVQRVAADLRSRRIAREGSRPILRTPAALSARPTDSLIDERLEILKRMQARIDLFAGPNWTTRDQDDHDNDAEDVRELTVEIAKRRTVKRAPTRGARLAQLTKQRAQALLR